MKLLILTIILSISPVVNLKNSDNSGLKVRSFSFNNLIMVLDRLLFDLERELPLPQEKDIIGQEIILFDVK